MQLLLKMEKVSESKSLFGNIAQVGLAELLWAVVTVREWQGGIYRDVQGGS